MNRETSCRFCGAALRDLVVDLGMSPLANAYVRPEQLGAMESFFPLRALVCRECLLVQVEDYETPEAIFSDYAYFSSYSTTWLEHARRFALDAIDRFSLDADSLVVEVASNDGYLLRWFHERGIPVLGVEPAANVAKVALQAGIPTLVEFLGAQSAEGLTDGRRADLVIANNVLAHVPDLNDFVAGLATLLAPGGVLTIEFPHLLRLLEDEQFDAIYHEHFSYFSFGTASRVLARHGIALVDVEELPTHGGSLRVVGRHAGPGVERTGRAEALLAREREAGLDRVDTYGGFGERVKAAKRDLLELLIDRRRRGERVVGYGAPAKAATLLNYCGIGTDFLDFTVDRSPHKQGCFLPGVHVPILAPEAIDEAQPEVILILPWNLRGEIEAQLAHVRLWGARFAVHSPRVLLW